MQNLLKAGLTIGLMAGFFFILLFITLFALDTPLTSLMYNADWGLIVFFVFITQIYFRDYLNYQEMRLTEGLISGMIGTLLSALIISLFIFVLMNFITPDALANDVKLSIAGLLNKNEEGKYFYVEKYGQVAFDEQLLAFKTITVNQIATLKFASISLIGFVFSLVFSIFLRKKHVTEA